MVLLEMIDDCDVFGDEGLQYCGFVNFCWIFDL